MQEEVLGPKYAIRLGDLKPWHVLRVTCLRRRHAAVVAGRALRRALVARPRRGEVCVRGVREPRGQ